MRTRSKNHISWNASSKSSSNQVGDSPICCLHCCQGRRCHCIISHKNHKNTEKCPEVKKKTQPPTCITHQISGFPSCWLNQETDSSSNALKWERAIWGLCQGEIKLQKLAAIPYGAQKWRSWRGHLKGPWGYTKETIPHHTGRRPIWGKSSRWNSGF